MFLPLPLTNMVPGMDALLSVYFSNLSLATLAYGYILKISLVI